MVFPTRTTPHTVYAAFTTTPLVLARCDDHRNGPSCSAVQTPVFSVILARLSRCIGREHCNEGSWSSGMSWSLREKRNMHETRLLTAVKRKQCKDFNQGDWSVTLNMSAQQSSHVPIIIQILHTHLYHHTFKPTCCRPRNLKPQPPPHSPVASPP
jgi:hypothetical protein